MKKLLTIFLFCFSLPAQAGDIYQLDPNHINITWSANHFGFSTPSGKFTRAEGSIILDEIHPNQSSVDVTIYTDSISSGIAKFDEHLKSEDFLNSTKFPTAKFISKEITLLSNNKARIKGDFTMLGVTKTLILEARLNKLAINPITQKKTAGFSAVATIKRSDYNMIYGIPSISDNVKITIEAEAIFSSSEVIAQTSEEKKENIAYIANPKWNLVSEGSSISFIAKQKQSLIKGTFDKVSGSILFNKNEQKGNKVTIEVDTTSLDMNFTDALQTLKTTPWLAVEGFPKAVLVAENFVALSDKKMRGEGSLTIKNKTVPVKFDFEFKQYNKTDALAIGSFKVNRRDFDIGSNDRNVDDEVTIGFIIKAKK